jgi:hypothetical protein
MAFVSNPKLATEVVRAGGLGVSRLVSCSICTTYTCPILIPSTPLVSKHCLIRRHMITFEASSDNISTNLQWIAY